MDDAELLAAWHKGDARAGNDLLERHFASLYRFFAAKVGPDASELIQSTLTACVANLDGLRRAASFRAYLFAAARNQLYDHLRRKQKQRVIDGGVTSIHDLATSPSAVVARRQEHARLLSALRRIPIELQIALELHYWDGLTSRELAEVLEVPIGTAKSRLRRAKTELRAELEALAARVPDVPNAPVPPTAPMVTSVEDAVRALSGAFDPSGD